VVSFDVDSLVPLFVRHCRESFSSKRSKIAKVHLATSTFYKFALGLLGVTDFDFLSFTIQLAWVLSSTAGCSQVKRSTWIQLFATQHLKVLSKLIHERQFFIENCSWSLFLPTGSQFEPCHAVAIHFTHFSEEVRRTLWEVQIFNTLFSLQISHLWEKTLIFTVKLNQALNNRRSGFVINEEKFEIFKCFEWEFPVSFCFASESNFLRHLSNLQILLVCETHTVTYKQ